MLKSFKMPKSSYARRPPARKIVKRDVGGRPEWEGKRCPFVRMRDLSLKEDGDVWTEMVKVTFTVHDRVDNVICRREAEVELTDVSCQVDLISGSIGGIGFSSGGGLPQRRRGSPNRAPTPLARAPPAAEPVASSQGFSVRRFKGDEESSPSTAEANEAERQTTGSVWSLGRREEEPRRRLRRRPKPRPSYGPRWRQNSERKRRP